MTGEQIAVLATVVLGALFVWWIVRVDARAEDAHQRWYDDPRHVWNCAQPGCGRPHHDPIHDTRKDPTP